MLLNVLCIILCYSVLPSRCYAAWFPTSNYTAWPSLTDVMLLNVVTSDRVTLFGLVFMMLRCLVFSTSCLATQRMNFISKGFSTQNYSGSTSFSCLASAASLVAIFWFQLEKSAGEVRRPKLQILWRNWWSKDNNSLSSSRNKLTFIYFYLPAKACTSALGMKRRARPQTFRCQANAAQHLASLAYTLSAKYINAKRP